MNNGLLVFVSEASSVRASEETARNCLEGVPLEGEWGSAHPPLLCAARMLAAVTWVCPESGRARLVLQK